MNTKNLKECLVSLLLLIIMGGCGVLPVEFKTSGGLQCGRVTSASPKRRHCKPCQLSMPTLIHDRDKTEHARCVLPLMKWLALSPKICYLQPQEFIVRIQLIDMNMTKIKLLFDWNYQDLPIEQLLVPK